MKRTRSRLHRAAALLAGLCLYALTAHSATFDWTGHAGSGNGEWGTNGDWKGGSHPKVFSDTAMFNNPP
jgi:hypothetical protein